MSFARAMSASTGAVKAPSASLPGGARFAAAERRAKGEIARLRRRAGEDEIAEAGRPGQRFGLGAERAAEARQFGEAAGGQRRRALGAELLAGDDAGRNGEHVLGRAADLDAAHVGRVIGAERR